jgi:hypothetical protein
VICLGFTNAYANDSGCGDSMTEEGDELKLSAGAKKCINERLLHMDIKNLEEEDFSYARGFWHKFCDVKPYNPESDDPSSEKLTKDGVNDVDAEHLCMHISPVFMYEEDESQRKSRVEGNEMRKTKNAQIDKGKKKNNNNNKNKKNKNEPKRKNKTNASSEIE